MEDGIEKLFKTLLDVNSICWIVALGDVATKSPIDTYQQVYQTALYKHWQICDRPEFPKVESQEIFDRLGVIVDVLEWSAPLRGFALAEVAMPDGEFYA